MEWIPLSIEGAWRIVPQVFDDARGSFREIFKADQFRQAVGHGFHLEQANTSISQAGVIRGIHFAEVPPSQAKYVMCLEGEILDYVVDLRVGSPTFGKWEGVRLRGTDPSAVYLSEGLGHAFISLANDSTVTYLCSTGYNPQREHGVSPHDPQIGIDWPQHDVAGNPLPVIMSDKDVAAPTLAEAEQAGLLPTYEEVLAYRRSLS